MFNKPNENSLNEMNEMNSLSEMKWKFILFVAIRL